MPSDSARTLIIGDVHGCIDELRDLVQRFRSPGDAVVLVGDLVAKGPDSRAVVQYARESGFAAVLGNHDNKVVECRRPRPGQSPPRAHHHRVADSLSDEEFAWLAELPLHLTVTAGVSVIHGGAIPGVALADQKRDHLLALRSIASDGSPSTRVDGGAPWASLWTGPEYLVFGHDAVRGLQQWPHATGLDTGCVYGRALTALVLPERTLVSVPARRAWAPM